MIVYHGSTSIIDSPDVEHSKRYLDFRQGVLCDFLSRSGRKMGTAEILAAVRLGRKHAHLE